MPSWISQAMIYHLYPLGALGAPWTNAGGSPVSRINALEDWIAPASRIGANTLLLGPLWESGTHGYDTHDYTRLDRRLGTNEDLTRVLSSWKAKGFRILFDGVFNHVGREFPPFVDLRQRGRESRYATWFAGVDFSRTSPFSDPFSYEGWNGHYNLVKLNLQNPEVREFLLAAVGEWIDHYDLDGLRLDAADVIDKGFLRDLASFCRQKKSEFWLMGEVIHGDYNEWAPGAGLDAVTNYELFKGLWSSHNDANYFEAAWTLNRQFGPEGLYRGQLFSTFGDNHDVNRLASTLTDPGHLYPHAILTATTPGIPTIYYGTEAGMEGRKNPTGDEPLRPALTPQDLDTLPHQALRDLWTTLAGVRHREEALRTGGYRQAAVASKQLAFWRTPEKGGGPVLVAVNSDKATASWTVDLLPEYPAPVWTDLLEPGSRFEARGGQLTGTVWPRWGRILVPA